MTITASPMPLSTMASGQGSPYFSSRSRSSDPALTPMRIEQPASDAQLDALIQRALAQNLTLQQAQLRMRAARAREHLDTVLPGYTHLQRAVVSSTAMWFAGFAEGFIDDAQRDILPLRGVLVVGRRVRAAQVGGVNLFQNFAGESVFDLDHFGSILKACCWPA